MHITPDPLSLCQSRPKTSMEYFPCRLILKAMRLLLGVHPIPVTISPSGQSAQHLEYFLIGLYSNTILPCPPKILPVFSRHRHQAVQICSLTSTPYRGYLSTSKVKIVFLRDSPMPFMAENAYLPQRMRQLSESFSKVMRVSLECREMRQQVGLQQTNRQGFWTVNFEIGHSESLILIVLSGTFFCSKSNLSIRYISLLVVRLLPGRLLLLYPPMMYPLLNLQIVNGSNLLILIFLDPLVKSSSYSVRNCPSISANRKGGINSTMNSYFSLGTLFMDLVRVLKMKTLRTPLQMMWLWQQKNSTIFSGRSIVVFYFSCVEGFQEESEGGDSLLSISPIALFDYNWGTMVNGHKGK